MYNWRLPDWINDIKGIPLSCSLDDALEYCYWHDCGKPYCRTIDEHGRAHFPNHAAKSAETYALISDNKTILDLIRQDMDIHLLKADGTEEFTKRPHAITLLLAGLCEIHANADHLGGLETTAFKIKFKQINQRGKAICRYIKGVSHD